MKKSLKQLAVFCLFSVLFIMVACSCKNTVDDSQYERKYLTSSWSYNYGSVQELADHCDLAAYVKITGMETDDTNRFSGLLTIYTAEIQESLCGKENGTIRIVMTGTIDEKEKIIFEIEDDPLMKTGDEFFIFAEANEDETYTILSGPQGRFVIRDNLVYSLNVCNEQVAKMHPHANITVDKQPKEEFYAQIREYVANKKDREKFSELDEDK